MKHRGRLEIDSVVMLKGGKKWAGERHALLLGRWKVTIPGVNHRLCWPLRNGQSQVFPFFCVCRQPSFFCCCYFLFVQFSYFLLFFGSLFVFSYFSSSLHVGSENSEERQATSLGLLGQQPLQPSHLPSL